MSKNTKGTILNENTIRRFMKLAAIEPLAESYLDQFTEEEDEEMAPAEEPAMDDMGAEAPADDLAEPAGDEEEAPATRYESKEEEKEELEEAEDEAEDSSDEDLEEALIKRVAQRVAERLTTARKTK